ncbi:unnamed protein product [Ixodes hexagonus]
MLLIELAATLLVLGSERSTLFDRVALRLLKHVETRMRNLVLIAAGSTALLTMVLDDTLAVLVVCSVLASAVRALQDVVVQGHHQRALFVKATCALPSFRKRQLEDMLWPKNTDEATVDISTAVCIIQSPTSFESSETTTPGNLTEENLWDGIMYSGEGQPEKARTPRHTPPRQPAYPARSSFFNRNKDGPPKRAAFFEEGEVILPGSSSPLPKPSMTCDDALMRLPFTTLFKQEIIRDVMFWETKRYKVIYRDLVLCSAITSVLVSTMSFEGNAANRFFTQYFLERFGQKLASWVFWWVLLTPMFAMSGVAFWQNLGNHTLRRFDAPQDQESAGTISAIIGKQLDSYGSLDHWKYMSMALFLVWTCRRSRPFVVLVNDFLNPSDILVVDYTMVMILFVIPVSSSSVLMAPFNEYQDLAVRMPWTALMVNGCSVCIAVAIKESSMVAWFVKYLPANVQYKFVTQIVFTLTAAILTELVGNAATVSIILPVATDVAVKVPVNPLYFAIPVTVAASTTLVLPTASFALAYVYDRLDIGPWDLMVCGLVVKLVCVAIIILTVSTLGNFIFHWNIVPTWLSRDLAANASIVRS